ncbi:MAG TPA: DinB family protein [Candidatus Solibacter sp.]|nr:DinB family protein [Candidatus Solibacter sp.]
MTPDTLKQHIAYTTWATDRIMRFIEQIPPEHLTHDFQTADRTILGTLVHTFAADRIWLTRILGAPPRVFLADDERNLATLQREWPIVLQHWNDWAGTLQDPNTTMTHVDLKGNPWTHQVWEVVLHVVNHATHHRGQVSGFLRALGHTPPQLDLIRFYRGVS